MAMADAPHNPNNVVFEGDQRTTAWHALRDRRLTASAFANALGTTHFDCFFCICYSSNGAHPTFVMMLYACTSTNMSKCIPSAACAIIVDEGCDTNPHPFLLY